MWTPDWVTEWWPADELEGPGADGWILLLFAPEGGPQVATLHCGDLPDEEALAVEAAMLAAGRAAQENQSA